MCMLDRTHCLSLCRLLSSVTDYIVSVSVVILRRDVPKGLQRERERERKRGVCVCIFLVSTLPGITGS